MAADNWDLLAVVTKRDGNTPYEWYHLHSTSTIIPSSFPRKEFAYLDTVHFFDIYELQTSRKRMTDDDEIATIISGIHAPCSQIKLIFN